MTSRPDAVEPPTTLERRHGDRRRAGAGRSRDRIRMVAIIVVIAAVAAAALSVASVERVNTARNLEDRRELIQVAGLRMRAMAATEDAHLRIFRERTTSDPAVAKELLATWSKKLAAVSKQIPTSFGSEIARRSADQLRRVLHVKPAEIAGDAVLAARTQLMPIQNRLVESATQSGLTGDDAAADQTTEQMYVLGIATDVAVAAASGLPQADPAWTGYGLALRALGGAGAMGVIVAGPLAGWTVGPNAMERTADVVSILMHADHPSKDFLKTVVWALRSLDVGHEPEHPDPHVVSVIGELLGNGDTNAAANDVGAFGESPGIDPPMALGDMLAEASHHLENLSADAERRTADRLDALGGAATFARADASARWLAAIAVVVASLVTLLLFLVIAKRAARRSERRARIDPLTGLMNRIGLAEALDARLDDPEPGSWVVLIDLDLFKRVNDTFGHAMGDAVITGAAAHVQTAADELGGVAARLGGDEFAIVAPPIDVHRVDQAVAALIDRLQQVEEGGRSFALGCSIGIVECREGNTAEDVLNEADLAMYRAKRGGRNRAVHFDDATRGALERFRDGSVGDTRVELGVRVQRSLIDRSIVGVMVRPSIVGPKGDEIDARDLRLVAEFAGTRFGVLDTSIAAIQASGRKIPPAGIRLWFGVRAGDVVAFDGVEQLVSRLQSIGLTGTPVGVALMEAGHESPDQLIASVAAIRACGIPVAVEVTGPGAVGLPALTGMEVDRLLIDPGAVEAVRREDPVHLRAVRAIGDIGERLGAEVAAVDVPNLNVAATLRSLGIVVAQVAETEPWSISEVSRELASRNGR